MTMHIEIKEIKDNQPIYLETAQRLMDQLTTHPVKLTEEVFRQILASENSHLFFLWYNEQIAGMLTVGTYYSPTGGKAWIEDVVIDSQFRGKGLSRKLVAHAIQFTQSLQIPTLMLTSNPKRIAANKLYQSMEFQPKETNVYKMNL